MRTKLLAICFAVLALGSFGISQASAREVTPSAAAVAALPSTVRVNEVEVSIHNGHRSPYRHYRHYHHVYHHSRRTVIYRHGRRVVIYR